MPYQKEHMCILKTAMDYHHYSSTIAMMLFFLMAFLLGFASPDLEQDRTECSNQLAGLATCLPYVEGQAPAPTKDCCGGFKQVLDTSKKCVCILIKDRNDPKLGLKINATLAVHLPAACHQTAPRISQCVSILHLPPNSPEAKEFESLGKLEGNATTPPSPSKEGTSSPAVASEKNDGGKKKRWLEVETIIYGVLLSAFASYIAHLL